MVSEDVDMANTDGARIRRRAAEGDYLQILRRPAREDLTVTKEKGQTNRIEGWLDEVHGAQRGGQDMAPGGEVVAVLESICRVKDKEYYGADVANVEKEVSEGRYDPIILELLINQITSKARPSRNDCEENTALSIAEKGCSNEEQTSRNMRWHDSARRWLNNLRSRMPKEFMNSKSKEPWGDSGERQDRKHKGCSICQHQDDFIGMIATRRGQRNRGEGYEKRDESIQSQEKKERVAAFMASLEGSTEEEEWEDDYYSMCLDGSNNTSEEEIGLSNLLFNSQSLSYVSQDDPDYTILCDHSLCRRLLSSEHFDESTNVSSIIPSSLAVENRSYELMPTNQQVEENSMSVGVNIVQGVPGQGENSRNKLNEEKVYSATDMERTIGTLKLYSRRINKERKGRSRSQHSSRSAKGVAGRRGKSVSLLR